METATAVPLIKSSAVTLKSRLLNSTKVLSLCYITSPIHLRSILHTLFPMCATEQEYEAPSVTGSMILGNLAMAMISQSPIMVIQSPTKLTSVKFYLLSNIESFTDELDTTLAHQELKFTCESSVDYLNWLASFKAAFGFLALGKGSNCNELPVFNYFEDRERDIQLIRQSMHAGDRVNSIHNLFNEMRPMTGTSPRKQGGMMAEKPELPPKTPSKRSSVALPGLFIEKKEDGIPAVITCGSPDGKNMQWSTEGGRWIETASDEAVV